MGTGGPGSGVRRAVGSPRAVRPAAAVGPDARPLRLPDRPRTRNSRGQPAAGRATGGPGPAVGAGVAVPAAADRLPRAAVAAGGRGRREGVSPSAQAGGGPAIEPVIVLRVEDGAGRILAEWQPQEQHVLSAQLAFLLADMLSDESIPTYPSEINRPAGVVHAAAGEGQLHWTLGFTPQRVVGVWLAAH